ncbi:glycoside hydrolase family 43 protein [Streptomyces sp. NBC_01334]|uniref:glycoside hydrolase family 43 protein n=1 Tax=Streptomyces sp. NBC_01334 TaxID=2903827 RepID=UPI002E150C9E|nr:family 43 glycosylhydrolase [Streptomyces sp. NBC_01334]
MQLPVRPVLPGFHPDPSVCRVGDVYYLANSSFEYAPGVPIHRSTDLRTWEHVGHALDRPSQLPLEGVSASGGILAPTLRHHDGRFWMISTLLVGEPRMFLVTAEDAAGPWSDPVWIPDALGIDPDLAWDDDACLLTWTRFGEGIVQAVLDPRTGSLLTERRRLWQGTGGKFPEGPHLYRIGAFWYLLIAEGGTERGHAVTIARGPSPSGPFEACPGNPILTARGSDAPVQSTGHADLVRRPDGTWAMVYLGVRPRGSSPEWHVLGRETFACEVRWSEGWPGTAAPIQPDVAPELTEHLREAGQPLPPSWVAPGAFPADVLKGTDHGLRLTATAGPAFVGRRQEHLYLRARATVVTDGKAGGPGGSGGLELRIDARHAVRVEVADGRVRAVARIGAAHAVLGEAVATEAAAGGTTLELRVVPHSAASPFGTDMGPDEVVAGLHGTEGFRELGRIDGRYLSTEVAAGMTGRTVGLTCSAGEVLFRSFTYSGADDPEALDGG